MYESKLIPAFDSLNAPQTLFAEVLVKGQATLYFLRDPMQKDRFYIAKGTEALRELKIEEFKQKNMQEGRKLGHTMLMRRELYKPVLLQTFMDCKSITEADIHKVTLSYNSLSNIVKKYNNCSGEVEYVKPKQDTEVSFGPVAGVSSSTLTYKIEDKDQNFDNTSVKPVVGAFINLMFPYFSERLSLQVEMLYAPNYFESSFEDDPMVPGNSTGTIEIDVKHLKVPTLIRYTYPGSTIKPHINVGPTWSYAVSQKNQANKTTTLGGTTRNSNDPFLEDDEFRKLTLGFTAGAGISYNIFNKPLTLEARYEKNRGITNLKGQTSSIQSLFVMLSYKL